MQLNRRITNGLAWAGVLLVVGVPTADFLSAQIAGNSAPERVAVVAPVAPVPAPAEERPATPEAEAAVTAPAAAEPAPQTAGVVSDFLQSGRPLPSYITGADPAPERPAVATPARPPIAADPAPTQTAAAPAAAARPTIVTAPTTTPAVDPVQVASIGPQKVAPMPMPLSMRPRSVAAAPVVTTPLPPASPPIAAVPPIGNEPVIIPPEVVRPPATVTASDLEDWEAGPLSEFLAQRNGQAEVPPPPQGDGFWLDEYQPQGDRVVGWQERRGIWFP